MDRRRASGGRQTDRASRGPRPRDRRRKYSAAAPGIGPLAAVAAGSTAGRRVRTARGPHRSASAPRRARRAEVEPGQRQEQLSTGSSSVPAASVRAAPVHDRDRGAGAAGPAASSAGRAAWQASSALVWRVSFPKLLADGVERRCDRSGAPSAWARSESSTSAASSALGCRWRPRSRFAELIAPGPRRRAQRASSAATLRGRGGIGRTAAGSLSTCRPAERRKRNTSAGRAAGSTTSRRVS